jgi:hypothetical protein
MSQDSNEGRDGMLPAVHGSASLSERQEHEPKFKMPTWGNSVSAAEMITMMLQREGTRDEALDMLAMTLADLGITGEEIGHWQNKPGICHDCKETGERNDRAWEAKLKSFPQEPFEYSDTYWKKDGPSGRKYRQNAGGMARELAAQDSESPKRDNG